MAFQKKKKVFQEKIQKICYFVSWLPQQMRLFLLDSYQLDYGFI